MRKTRHFKGLNGLRAIASIAVVFFHITISLKNFGLDDYLFGKFPDGTPKSTILGGFGVSIFFSLSGFLITYLLLEEKKKTKININYFYFRRILRIWPLYYLYFFVVICTLLIFKLPFKSKSVLYYVFLAANIPYAFGGSVSLLTHYWSIGVEEQFYFFWPWVVKKSKSILKHTILICVLFILLKLALRINDIFNNNGKLSIFYLIIHVTRFQCMLMGAIGAILYFKKNKLFLKITNNIYAQAVMWIIILLLSINKFHLISVLDNEFISLVTVFLIIGQTNKTNRIVNLEMKFFDFLGRISFGIYVIHPIVIFYLSKIIYFETFNTLNYIMVYLSVFLTTIFFAYVSFELYEKKFLKWKEKFTIIKSQTRL